jgi:peroxiredoxin
MYIATKEIRLTNPLCLFSPSQYYKLLMKLDWQKKKLSNESAEKGASWQWVAQAPGADDDEPPLMMLPTDHSLIEDDSFRPWVEKYAEDRGEWEMGH